MASEKAACEVGSNFYTLLGIEKNASPGEIKQAYRKLAVKYHPGILSTVSKTSKKRKQDIKIDRQEPGE